MEYRESIEKAETKKREQEQLAAWEEAQKKKDAVASESRQARKAMLEEKKKRLAALKKASNGESFTEVNALEEASKLAKQMRIQNLAKAATREVVAWTMIVIKHEHFDTIVYPNPHLASSTYLLLHYKSLFMFIPTLGIWR